MRVIGFDHLVLNVSDVRRSLDFYVGTLRIDATTTTCGTPTAT